MTFNVANNLMTWIVGDKFYVIGQITFAAGDSYPAGGFPISLAHPLVKSTKAPEFVEINSPSGYMYSYIPAPSNPTVSNGKLKIMVNAAAGSPHGELTAGPIPAGVQSDILNCMLIFPGGQR